MIPKSEKPLWVLWHLSFLTATAFVGANISGPQSRSEVKERRTIFPGPVTPDKFCPTPSSDPSSSSSSSSSSSGASGSALELQLRRLLDAADQVSGDSSVLLFRYAENLVRNRAYFLSLALQLQDSFGQFAFQPGFLYYYASAATALFTTPDALVGAGVFFDADKHYPNWYRYVSFNRTMARFAPRAVRGSTPVFRVDDYAALARDYTTPARGHGSSDPYPDVTVIRFQHQDKQGRISNRTIFAAPYVRGLRSSDVYYDCAHGNRWLMTLAFRVVEVLPRYTLYAFLRNPRNVAAATADLDVSQLLSGLPAEVTGNHSQLQVSRNCPDPVPAVPDSGTPGPAFFRSLYPQSRLALRLAHSLGAFLQNLDLITETLDYENDGITYGPYQPIPDTPSAKILADAPMNDTLLEAEVLANVMADRRVQASGVFFEVEQVVGSDGVPVSTPRKAFQAWRGPHGLVVGDLSTFKDPNPALSNKTRVEWQNADTDPRVQTFQFHAGIRSSMAGGVLANFTVDPLQYRGVSLNDGVWTSPYFKCDGYVDLWAVTYAAPFFGPSVAEPGKLILLGMVTVDVEVSAANWAVSE